MHSPNCDYCNKILDVLSQNKFLWPGAIARKISTNPSTIRRHMMDLREKGMVEEKIYAGVKLYGKRRPRSLPQAQDAVQAMRSAQSNRSASAQGAFNTA